MKKLVIALVIIMCTVAVHFGYSSVQSVKAVQAERLAQLNQLNF